MKRFLFHYLASHFLADRNSTTTNKEEKEQEIWRTQTNLWWFFLSFVVGLWLARKKKSQPKTTEGYDYYLSPSIFSSFVYINFSKDESENRRGNNLLYPSVSSHLCLGFGYIIKHSVQIPDDESRHRSPRAKKCYPTSGRAVNPKSWLVNMHILCTPWLIK